MVWAALAVVVAASLLTLPPLSNPSRPSYYAVNDGSHLGSKSQRRQGQADMMVFDFIRKRAEEGIQQVQNIATKTAVRRWIDVGGIFGRGDSFLLLYSY